MKKQNTWFKWFAVMAIAVVVLSGRNVSANKLQPISMPENSLTNEDYVAKVLQDPALARIEMWKQGASYGMSMDSANYDFSRVGSVRYISGVCKDAGDAMSQIAATNLSFRLTNGSLGWVDEYAYILDKYYRPLFWSRIGYYGESGGQNMTRSFWPMSITVLTNVTYAIIEATDSSCNSTNYPLEVTSDGSLVVRYDYIGAQNGTIHVWSKDWSYRRYKLAEDLHPLASAPKQICIDGNSEAVRKGKLQYSLSAAEIYKVATGSVKLQETRGLAEVSVDVVQVLVDNYSGRVILERPAVITAIPTCGGEEKIFKELPEDGAAKIQLDAKVCNGWLLLFTYKVGIQSYNYIYVPFSNNGGGKGG